jgi:flagella basal body P-ring formation protein FlgA
MSVKSFDLLSGRHHAAASQRAAAQDVAALQPLDAIAPRPSAPCAPNSSAVPGVTLDGRGARSRLRLPACGAPTRDPGQRSARLQSRVLVRVACPRAPAGQSTFRSKSAASSRVFVLRRCAGRGERCCAADVMPQKRVIAGLASPFVARVEDLDGALTRRPLAEGTAVTAEALHAALLIHRGQTVTLTPRRRNRSAALPAGRMSDAGARQRLRVQNLESLKVSRDWPKVMVWSG